MTTGKTSGGKKLPKIGTTRIIKRIDVTDDLMLIWIEKPSGFTFKAGQYCTIGKDGDERAYSIVSAPFEDSLELFVELVPPPDGVLTPNLWVLEPGDEITIRPRAKGIFTFKPTLPNHLLISTVTGVVPYIGYLRQYIHDGQKGHHFYILQGASYMHEFTYDKELDEMAVDHAEFVKYVPTVSRPKSEHNDSWTGATGRVNEIVEPYIEEFGLMPSNTLVYACGHPGMIEDVKKRLIPRGFEVEEERFWKEDE